MAPRSEPLATAPVLISVEEIDVATVADFRAQLDAAIRARSTGGPPSGPLVFDLRHTTFMDSTGVQALVEVDHALRDAGGGIRVLADGSVRMVLEVTGLWDLVGAEEAG